MKNSSEKIALVTGANKGIGHEVARQLAALDCTVLLGARNRVLGHEAAAQLAGKSRDVRFIEIDLDDSATIAAAVDKIEADFGRLDILVNNAGMIPDGDGPASTSSTVAIERVLRVNFVATVAVTQAMLPLLRKSSCARIVNVSSGLGSLTRSGVSGSQLIITIMLASRA